MQKLTITTKPYTELPNSAIAVFNGDFDGSEKENTAKLQAFVDSSTPGTTLIFDFSELNFLNSYAIGQMVAWHNHLNKNSGKIVVVNANKSVEEIFAILGMNNIFKIYRDLNTAVLDLKGES